LLQARRRDLRRTQTKAEALLWQKLSNRRLNNFRFCRQYSVGPYILDFYCPKLRLAIEIDGPTHDRPDSKLYDKERSIFLDGANIKVLRFKNEEVESDIVGVVEKIKEITP